MKFVVFYTELVTKNGCHTHINAEKWSGENLINLTACYGHAYTHSDTVIYIPIPISDPPTHIHTHSDTYS